MNRQKQIDQYLEDGKQYFEKKSYELALQNFLDALELDKDNPDTHYYLGIVYARMGRYDWAVDYLQKVFDSELAYINKIHTAMILGYLYTLQERYEEALELFRSIIDMGLESAQAYAAIGYIYAESNLNLDEALKECKKAVSLDRGNPAYLDSLGWVYYKLGEKSQARSYLKKALKKAPANEEIKSHLQALMD